MEIIFTKKEEGQHLINCKRKDGTETWMKLSSFFVMHDLMHFDLESEFRFTTAFYGMIENGVAISDFELPKENRNFELTPEAIFAEHLVNLLLIEATQGVFENFEEEFAKAVKHETEYPKPDVVKLDVVRKKFGLLTDKWNTFELGNSLELKFGE